MPLRNETEIQLAHDVFSGILLKEVPMVLDPKDLHHVHIACDVLCWVLKHDHNKAFGKTLANILKAADDLGFEVTMEKPK